MKHKPIQFLVLAVIQALTPFSNIALACWNYHHSPMWIIRHMMAAGMWSSLFFFALGPLTGVAILTVRRWSYAIIFTSTLWCMISNLLAWKAHPEVVSIPLLISVELLPMALLAYFLAPSTRVLFFHASVRWWEAKPRYEFLSAAVCERGGEELFGTVKNLSEGGIFLESDHEFSRGETVTLEFVHRGEVVRVGSTVVYHLVDQGGYGMQFQHTAATKAQIRRITRELEKAHVARIPERRHLISETSDLAKNLAHGKLLFPELSPTAQKKLRRSA